MCKVFWDSIAQADRETIFSFLCREAGLTIAENVDNKFIEIVCLLTKNPFSGIKAGKNKTQRKIIVPRLPFVIVYVVENNHINILRILHTSRKIASEYKFK